MLIISESIQVERTEKNFITTYTGAKFWPLNPRGDEIVIDYIAHALSLICRFTGHTYCVYSVAEHSLRVSKLAQYLILKYADARGYSRGREVVQLAREVALWGLLHDASEAYLCDVPSPIKHASILGQLYRGFESGLMDVIADRFELMPTEPSVVKVADRILLATEMRDLMTNCTPPAGITPLSETIFPMDGQRAEAEFLSRFQALTLARKADRMATASAYAEEYAAFSRAEAARNGGNE